MAGQIRVKRLIIISDCNIGRKIAPKAVRFALKLVQQRKRCGLATLNILQLSQLFIRAINDVNRRRSA